MSTEFDTFCESPLGAFIESPSGARDCPESTEEPRQRGCCCYTLRIPVATNPPHCILGPWAQYPEGLFVTVTRCQTVAESWFEAAAAQHGWDFTPRELCIYAHADFSTFDPEGDAPSYACENVFLWPYSPPECLFVLAYDWRCLHRRFISWKDRCTCRPIATDPDEPIPDDDEQCTHGEGYCCLLINDHWFLSPEAPYTWERNCTREVQQVYFRDEITDVHFDATEATPDNPCPDDPITTGWCCITLLDGRRFSSGGRENEEYEDCTIEAQQPIYPLDPILEVNWLGPVDNEGCDPCGIPEGSCCIRTSTMFPGVCIADLTRDECIIDLRVEGFQPNVWTGIEENEIPCQRCVDPAPPPDPSSWLGPRGRCCSSFEWYDGGTWRDRVTDCQVKTTEDCGAYRTELVANDRFRAFRFATWQPGWDCDIEPGSGTADERGCRSEQGWCCPEGSTANGVWTTRHECEVGRNGTLYPPRTNPDRLCALVRPCCWPRYIDVMEIGGQVNCDMFRPEECERLGGQSMGAHGDDCSDVECETGACCLGCSRCSDNMPPTDCEKLNGEYRGHGTRCSDIHDCPEGPL